MLNTKIQYLLTISLIALGIFVGIQISKEIISFNILDFTNQLEITSSFDTNEISHTLRQRTLLLPYYIVFYTLFIVSLVASAIGAKRKLLKHGWLLMSIILAGLFIPIELIIILFDTKLYYMQIGELDTIVFLGIESQNQETAFLEFYRNNFFSIYKTLSTLSHIFIMGVLFIKPLNKAK